MEKLISMEAIIKYSLAPKNRLSISTAVVNEKWDWEPQNGWYLNVLFICIRKKEKKTLHGDGLRDG